MIESNFVNIIVVLILSYVSFCRSRSNLVEDVTVLSWTESNCFLVVMSVESLKVIFAAYRPQ